MIARRVLFFVLYGLVLLFCLATGSPVLYFVLAAMTGMLLLSLISLLLVRLRFSLEETVLRGGSLGSKLTLAIRN